MSLGLLLELLRHRQDVRSPQLPGHPSDFASGRSQVVQPSSLGSYTFQERPVTLAAIYEAW